MLKIVELLLFGFSESSIKYCHFKSNLHLLAGMCGDTDLDILVDRNSYSSAVAHLVSCNFKRFQAKLPSSYPAVEDWIGFDEASGKLVHLHLHWQLTAGEPNLKGYRIPWETDVLETRVYDSEHQIYVASPEMEMLLLLVRSVLKYRSRDKFKSMFGIPYPAINSDIAAEYGWLIKRINLSAIKTLASRLLSSDIQLWLDEFLKQDCFSAELFSKIQPVIHQQFQQYRSYSPLARMLYRWYREFYAKSTQVISRKFGCLLVRRRVPATGGLLLAFMGADGSGKSTQVKQTLKWLGWKLDVGYVYFGSGDGPVSLLRKPLVLIGGRRNKGSKAGEANKNNLASKNLSLRKRIFMSLWALSLIAEKQSKLKIAIKARNKGMVVICDRFPQNQIGGFNDGPIMAGWINDAWPWSALAKYELKKFEQFCSVSPDLVIKLHVSEEISAVRKKDTPPEMIAKKIDLIRQLHFDKSVKIVDLYADQPLEAVSLAVRREIWNML